MYLFFIRSYPGKLRVTITGTPTFSLTGTSFCKGTSCSLSIYYQQVSRCNFLELLSFNDLRLSFFQPCTLIGYPS